MVFQLDVPRLHNKLLAAPCSPENLPIPGEGVDHGGQPEEVRVATPL